MSVDLSLLIGNIRNSIIAGATMGAALSQLRGFGVPEDVVQAARVEYETRVGIIRALRDPAALVDDPERVTWYPGPSESDVFWPQVKSKLRLGLPEDAVDKIDEASTKVLSVMDAPGAPEIATRGLVLGYVQSGKTTSFISVISKAADVGYRVFIVLSGVTDSLRSQTQKRVEDLLMGEADQRWYKLTTTDSDFSLGTDNAVALLSQADMRFVAVVKKNPARLRRLRDWLKAAGDPILANSPILIIDDEADQASIDVARPGGRASTINRLLLEILKKPKAAYVAYTATPFANLLVNPAEPKGLYPSKFIVSLPEPDGYFGAERMFGLREAQSEDEPENDGLDLIRSIPDEEAAGSRPPKGKGAVFSWEPTVEAALGESIRWFLLSSAARRVRKTGNTHSTMLIHTSMLAEAHNRMASVVEGELAGVRNRIAAKAEEEASIFRSEYLDEIARVRANEFGHDSVSFEALWAEIPGVLESVRVITDNYLSVDRLIYDDEHPATAIVVGGNTLSRGLTLEGLSSSYFVRSASAYDTLLQMGRWFGYRHGYEDLCRVWMTEELQRWFRDLSTVELEIRREIERYELEQITPMEVAVRIRKHPDMAITAAAKMRHAVNAQMSYDSQRVQTILFAHRDADWLADNKAAVRRLVERALGQGRTERTFPSGRRGLAGLDASEILEFIGNYRFHENSRTVNRSYLDKYVRNENTAGSLLKWNVVFVESPASEHEGIDFGLAGGNVLPLNRAKLKHSDDNVANLKAITSMRDRVADLDLSSVEITRRAGEIAGNVSKINDGALLSVRRDELPDWGLLAIYPIDKDSTPQVEGQLRMKLEAVDDLVGVAFFFPRASGPQSDVDYVSVDLSAELNEDLEEELAQMDAADNADSARLEAGSQSE